MCQNIIQLEASEFCQKCDLLILNTFRMFCVRQGYCPYYGADRLQIIYSIITIIIKHIEIKRYFDQCLSLLNIQESEVTWF